MKIASFDFYNSNLLIVGEKKFEVFNVAFYDRPSSSNQKNNSMRSYYRSMAESACNQLGWNLIKDGNSNTFMDIGTGARYDNRPALQRAINNTGIDTIIGCAFDRIGRSADVWEYIENDANLHNKNIMYVEYTERYNAIEDLVSNIIRTITGDYNL